MRRKSAIGGPAYVASTIGVIMLALVAWRLTSTYPATRAVLLLAALVALAGLGHGWRRHLRKQRLREKPEQLRI